MNWATGDPNNGGTYRKKDEDCAVLKSNGKWNDYPCNTRFRYICKARASKFHFASILCYLIPRLVWPNSNSTHSAWFACCHISDYVTLLWGTDSLKFYKPHDYVSCSKFTPKPRLHEIRLNLWHVHTVNTWVLFSSLRIPIWKIYKFGLRKRGLVVKLASLT